MLCARVLRRRALPVAFLNKSNFLIISLMNPTLYIAPKARIEQLVNNAVAKTNKI
jgi:hypothetical protein